MSSSNPSVHCPARSQRGFHLLVGLLELPRHVEEVGGEARGRLLRLLLLLARGDGVALCLEGPFAQRWTHLEVRAPADGLQPNDEAAVCIFSDLSYTEGGDDGAYSGAPLNSRLNQPLT